MNIKTLLRKMQILKEEYTVCSIDEGFGFIIRVYNDHKPQHAHIISADNKLLGRFIITKEPPEDKDEILAYKKELSSSLRKLIIKWANKIDKETNILNWKLLIIGWNKENPYNKI
jgi:hypothetical protein